MARGTSMKPESAVMSRGRPQTDAITQALAMVAAGSTKYAAAKKTGCTASALYRALKRVNLPLVPALVSPASQDASPDGSE